MKRILAFVLVLCMAVGLLACGKPAGNSGATGGNNASNEPRETTPIREDISDIKEDDLDLKSQAEKSNAAYITPEKFAGKKIQIAGMNGDTYLDFDNMGKGNYIWMMRAAIDEWAYLNNVEVTYVCSDDPTEVMATTNSGTNIDLSFMSNQTPGYANMGLSKPFTQEQRDEIAKICGAGFVDMMNYKGESHGVIFPWNGNHWFYWNDTVLESYGAMTPDEYFVDGTWNWASMEKCWEDATKDFNGNGKLDGNDTWGIGSNTIHLTRYIKVSEDPVTGKLTGIKGTNPIYMEYLQMLYKGNTQTLAHRNKGSHYITTTAKMRPLTYVGDCEWYNFEHLYKTLANGDVIKAAILPAYNDGQTVITYTSRFACLLQSCDEPEAAFSLLCYVLKCGMRYISDYSVGLYKNEYDGIQGASEWSKTWKENFEAVCEDRRAAFAEIEDWDQELYEAMVKKMFAEDTIQCPVKRYTGEVEEVDPVALPPASTLPLMVAEQEAWITKYNELYAS